MKIFFAGTPEFALPALTIISEKNLICGVLTQPAKAQGRGQRIAASPVKNLALKMGLNVFEPEKLDEKFLKNVAILKPDLLVCVAYGKIFKQDFLDLFPKGGINLHPSLLPRHRGPAPIPAAILAGDQETGVTIQRLVLKMDSGAILAQQKIELSENDTTASLSVKLADLGAELLAEVIEKIKNNQTNEKEQEDSQATYCKLIRSEDGKISFQESALTISRMIRAYYPWPLVYSFWKGKRLFFLKGGVYPKQLADLSSIPGKVLGIDKDYGILLNTIKGILFIKELQLECKKPLFWKDFLNGNRDFLESICGGN